MLERSPGRLTVILENQNVLEAPVFFQVKNAVTEGPQNVFNALGRQGTQCSVMVGRLNDDLVRPDPIHFVEHAFGLSIEVAFNAQRRKLVRHHTHRPTRRVTHRRRSTVGIRAVSLDFRRRFVLVPIAERAEAALDLDTFAHEVRRTLRAVCRDDYPPANNRIFSKLRHSTKSFQLTTPGKQLFYDMGQEFLNNSNCGWEGLAR